MCMRGLGYFIHAGNFQEFEELCLAAEAEFFTYDEASAARAGRAILAMPARAD
jgi:hypothetical protein